MRRLEKEISMTKDLKEKHSNNLIAQLNSLRKDYQDLDELHFPCNV